MRLTAVCLLALLMAGCATGHGGALAHQQGDSPPPTQNDEQAAVAEGEDAPLAQAPLERAVEARAKTSTSGARLAEEWSPELGAALKRHAEAPTVRNEVELAQAYHDAGILDQAYDHYQVAARDDPREAAAWDGLARIWRDWGYPHLGLGDAYRAVWADPASPVVRNTLGTILQLLGRNQAAQEQYARAVTLDPAAAYAHYNFAVVCAAQREYVAAAEAFERAAAIDPSLEVARIHAAEARRLVSSGAVGKGVTHERR
jgi:tetratricopeptide (TPR) repeat protein